MWRGRLTLRQTEATNFGSFEGFRGQSERLGTARALPPGQPDNRARVAAKVPPASGNISMSMILEEPPVDPARGYFSQLCVMLTGIASGVVEPPAGEALQSPTFHMGRRDGYHVVVAHLASSRTLREAADKCMAFGRGVDERADAHPYGPDWCHGFAQATTDAANDIAMYAATSTLPPVDKARLRAARTAARNLSPLGGSFPAVPVKHEPPRSHHEW